jgi:Receptor L domain
MKYLLYTELILCRMQVTGYVLIVGVHADVIPLTNLRIIRGQSLYKIEGSSRGYGLYIGQNYQPGVRGVGIKELQFTSLHGTFAGLF